MSYGTAILGDNQFLGVNHANQAKAAELYERFKSPDSIIEVIGAAYDAGVRDFMFTTHDRYVPVFEEIRRSNLFKGMYYTPCLPYAHKYWNQLSDKGPASLVASTVLRINPLQILPAAFGVLRGRVGGVTSMLTQIETLMCKGLPLRGVFLQNLAFDFLVALEQWHIIESFADAVTRKLGAEPGFITMNHPQAVSVLCDRIGLDRPWVCANYNLAGFRMNPSPEACEASYASRRTRNIAMSVFASGKAPPADAIDYVVERLHAGHIDAILFGSSSPANIRVNAHKIVGADVQPKTSRP